MRSYPVIGEKYGLLTIIAYLGHENQRCKVLCSCECGGEIKVNLNKLKTGHVKSCGCKSKTKLVIEQGQKFGYYTTIKEVKGIFYKGKKRAYVQRRFLCICDCGVKRIVHLTSLISGLSKSCGCRQKEIVSSFNKTHGMSKTAEYDAWAGLKFRCYNPKSTDFYLYGGRGIRVCTAIKNSFLIFFSCVGLRPTKKHSIDRIDPDGHYSCGACEDCKNSDMKFNMRWATTIEQANNKRNTVRINGKTLLELEQATGVNRKALASRISRGWSADRIINTPLLS